MSDNNQTTSRFSEFTAREKEVMDVAWHCLVNGVAPEIDLDKLMKHAKINTRKSATNIWGIIKRKLLEEFNDNPQPAPPLRHTPRGNRARAVDDDDDEEDEIRLGEKPKKVVEDPEDNQ